MLLCLDDVIALLREEQGDEATDAFLERVKARAAAREHVTPYGPRLYELFPGVDKIFRNSAG